MTLEQLESEVRALSVEAQASLLARLLEHFGQNAEIDPDTESVWAEEAEWRDRSLDRPEIIGISAKEALQRIRASFQ
jgi:hypothetical protein